MDVAVRDYYEKHLVSRFRNCLKREEYKKGRKQVWNIVRKSWIIL